MENVDKIAPALVAAQKAMRPVKQTAENPHFKSRFAPLSEVMDAAKGALHAHDIAVLQWTEGEDPSGFNLVTTLLHVSGQVIQGRVRMPLEKGTVQAAGSAITYGKRYGLAALLGIVADDDDDGHAASQRPVARPAKAPNGDTPPKKRLDERTDKDLSDLRTWAIDKGKPDLVEKIDEEFERRRDTVGAA